MNETQTPMPEQKREEMKMPQNSTTQENPVPHSAANGPVIVMLAVLMIIVLGAMFFWAMQLNKPAVVVPEITRPTAEQNNEPESTTAEAQTDSMGVVSSSDEIDAINADLESTNLDSLDAELGAIEAEFEASAQ